MSDTEQPTPGWTFVGRDGIPRPVKLIGGIHDVLPEVNRKRRESGKDPLTNQQAHDALTDQNIRGNDAMADFLIGYVTGIPLSGAGLLGAVMGASANASDAPSYHGSYSAPEPSPSYSDGGSSSSSYDSGSSSSSDSGGGASE